MSRRRESEWPLADEVARAIVAAARAEGEDPIAVASGRARSRARLYAFVALAHRFPTAGHTPLMKLCGANPATAFSAAVAATQIARGDGGKCGAWFRLETLNAVVAACGWPAMTASDAEMRRYPPRQPAPDEAPEPEVWPLADEPVELPMFIPPASDEAEKSDMPVAEAVEQLAPTPEPICQPEVAPKVSDAARAIASFQRGRTEKTRVAAKLAPEPPRAVFASTGAIDLHYRPDRPAGARGVEILTSDLMGDPRPDRSALAQRQSESEA